MFFWCHHLPKLIGRHGRDSSMTMFFKQVFIKHTFTCKQPPAGSIACRNGKPSGTSEETQPVQLVEVEEQEEGGEVQWG
jgi:hypothetical protein